MSPYTEQPPTFEGGVMFYPLTIDGAMTRGGITLPAFEHLITRAGLDTERGFGRIMVRDILSILKPTIEAYFQTKHFLQGGDASALIIDMRDLVTH